MCVCTLMIPRIAPHKVLPQSGKHSNFTPNRVAFSCLFGSKGHAFSCEHETHDLLTLVSYKYTYRWDDFVMAAWQAFLLGLVQGITEFLPISSSGHVVLLEHLLGIELNNRILFGALLHIGTLIPVILVFKRDIKRLFWGMIHIFVDLIKNFTIWFHNKKHRDDVRYRKILSTNYRKFTVLILISLIPTAVIGYILQKMASRAFDNLLAPAIGFFITAILLLVTEVASNQAEKSPKDTKYRDAVIIGVFQGFSVFPGLSRAGATLSAGFLCGFSRKYAIKYSYIMMIPTVLGAIVVELQNNTSRVSISDVGNYILGIAAASAAGYVAIRFMLSMVRQKKLRYFSAYCILVGVAAVAVNFFM